MTGSSMRLLLSVLISITMGLAMTSGAEARRLAPGAAPRPSETTTDVRIVSAPIPCWPGRCISRPGRGLFPSSSESRAMGPMVVAAMVRSSGI